MMPASVSICTGRLTISPAQSMQHPARHTAIAFAVGSPVHRSIADAFDLLMKGLDNSCAVGTHLTGIS